MLSEGENDAEQAEGQPNPVSAEAAQQMLSGILGSWTQVKTAKAAHPDMRPEDQQTVLDWLLKHKDATINKFAKVHNF